MSNNTYYPQNTFVVYTEMMRTRRLIARALQTLYSESIILQKPWVIMRADITIVIYKQHLYS